MFRFLFVRYKTSFPKFFSPVNYSNWNWWWMNSEILLCPQHADTFPPAFSWRPVTSQSFSQVYSPCFPCPHVQRPWEHNLSQSLTWRSIILSGRLHKKELLRNKAEESWWQSFQVQIGCLLSCQHYEFYVLSKFNPFQKPIFPHMLLPLCPTSWRVWDPPPGTVSKSFPSVSRRIIPFEGTGASRPVCISISE